MGIFTSFEETPASTCSDLRPFTWAAAPTTPTAAPMAAAALQPEEAPGAAADGRAATPVGAATACAWPCAGVRKAVASRPPHTAAPARAPDMSTLRDILKVSGKGTLLTGVGNAT